MNVSELLTDALGRVREQMPGVVAGLGDDELAWRPDPEANSIAWLIWHLSRIEDDHVAGAAGSDQAWLADGWADRFGLPFDDHEHGYAMTAADVGKVRATGDLLAGYYEAVAARTAAYVATLAPDDLDRVVDEAWDPPVTLGVRLVSVVNEVNAHLGQAQYVRGLLERQP
ncbi:MAG TPA: DUF664 domain-containing protein [Nocardioides sp.]|jgi:hypothetical protein|uniref:mycothiol transferase n=1 Tax=Nocardioides sp. TaxID=35761 RepID=UPI002E3788E7|nr:DUF664 domain-containing protein [Nocardioides sp.]HEX3929085.1 DUF664 domain-containing protein [Nocardioides sp.]